MAKIGEKTFKLLYESLPKCPTRSEVIDFIGDKLKAGEFVTRIHIYSSTGVVYVEPDTLEQAQKVVADNKRKHSLTIDGTTYTIPILMEYGVTGFRLLERPPYVTEEEIKSEMACYGEVVSVTEFTYETDTKIAGINTGIRAVKIIVTTPNLKIGPMIPIVGERTTLTYTGRPTLTFLTAATV